MIEARGYMRRAMGCMGNESGRDDMEEELGIKRDLNG